jgi:hypothetical protein
VQDLSGAAPCSELYLLDRENQNTAFFHRSRGPGRLSVVRNPSRQALPQDKSSGALGDSQRSARGYCAQHLPGHHRDLSCILSPWTTRKLHLCETIEDVVYAARL